MPTVRYPFELLGRLRKHEADQAAQDLAMAAGTRDAADSERRLAADLRDAHERKGARLRANEILALAAGCLRVADLAQAQSWELAFAAERRKLTSSARESQAAVAAALDAVRRFQSRASLCFSKAELVARDRTRWNDARRKLHEAIDEEASFEAWRLKS
ncbi:MAG: hypothetical protein ABSF69_06555 [Polyangiaceae bacterium]|jgi:hypothetical protein